MPDWFSIGKQVNVIQIPKIFKNYLKNLICIISKSEHEKCSHQREAKVLLLSGSVPHALVHRVSQETEINHKDWKDVPKYHSKVILLFTFKIPKKSIY